MQLLLEQKHLIIPAIFLLAFSISSMSLRNDTVLQV